ncbi:MAG: hypothetical protein R2843_09850 [Thermomicrobiales bacterium]
MYVPVAHHRPGDLRRDAVDLLQQQEIGIVSIGHFMVLDKPNSTFAATTLFGENGTERCMARCELHAVAHSGIAGAGQPVVQTRDVAFGKDLRDPVSEGDGAATIGFSDIMQQAGNNQIEIVWCRRFELRGDADQMATVMRRQAIEE